MRKIITYILKYNSPERDTDEEDALYYVSRVVKHHIRLFLVSLKVNDTNKKYFINGFNRMPPKLRVWQVPITESSQELIVLMDNMYHVTLLLFKPEIFPNINLLVLYFKKSFGKEHMYVRSLLSYYVLSSMRKYLNTPQITEYLPQIFGDCMCVRDHHFDTKRCFT